MQMKQAVVQAASVQYFYRQPFLFWILVPFSIPSSEICIGKNSKQTACSFAYNVSIIKNIRINCDKQKGKFRNIIPTNQQVLLQFDFCRQEWYLYSKTLSSAKLKPKTLIRNNSITRICLLYSVTLIRWHYITIRI